jgi:ankyrin repeat protein
LLKSGANPNVRDEHLCTPLYHAVANRCLKAVRLLLEAGADIHKEESCGWTPLSLACHRGYTNIVKEMVRTRESLDKKTGPVGQTALIAAASQGHHGVVALLLAEGVDVNLTDDLGQTPLMLAAAKGHERTVREIIGAGANVDTCDVTGETALQNAKDEDHAEVEKILKDAAVLTTPSSLKPESIGIRHPSLGSTESSSASSTNKPPS